MSRKMNFVMVCYLSKTHRNLGFISLETVKGLCDRLRVERSGFHTWPGH